MTELTNCWNCGLPYHKDAEQCPACNGVNANYDLHRAQHEMECSNPPNSKSALQMLCEVDDHLQELQHYGHSYKQRYATHVVEDLLEALQGITGPMDAPDETALTHMDFMVSLHWLRKARAAIARATGNLQ